MHGLLYLAISVSILAMRGHATEIWCIFGDKYVRCTLISVAAKGDQSISCDPRFLLHGNILCWGQFLPMDIMKRCLQGITLNWLLCTGHYFYPHQYLKCLKSWTCSTRISRFICPGWQGGSKKVKISPKMGLAFIYFWPRGLLEAPKCVKDPWNTPKMIPPTAPDWFESISGVLDPFRGF